MTNVSRCDLRTWADKPEGPFAWRACEAEKGPSPDIFCLSPLAHASTLNPAIRAIHSSRPMQTTSELATLCPVIPVPRTGVERSPRVFCGWRWLLIWMLAVAIPAGTALAAAGVAEHVVVVVFDGMRPDFVTPQYAPNLYSLATNGVFFRRNHPVFISTTIVNGTSLATGVHPGRNGILANTDYREELNTQAAVASEVLDTIRRGDLASEGRYVAVDTLAELIQDAGHATYVAGTKSVTLLHDRKARRTDTAAHSNSVTLGRGLILPRSGGDPLKKVNDDKVFPDTFTTPNLASDSWTTKALTRGLWRKTVPKYSLLWLSDPDVTQHAKGVGAPESLSAIEASDKHLGEVIKVLKEKGVYEKTDLFVVSDHGFSSIARTADIVATLKQAKLSAHSKLENPERGDVLVIGLGGAALIYVTERDESVVRAAAAALQMSDSTGVLFSRLSIEGTFPLSAVHYPMEGHGPDLVVSMRWMAAQNEHEAPGMLIATGGARGGGTHGSLSRFEMNNTLVASGPDLKKGLYSEIPSGNIDLAPTILYLLGIEPKQPMDGRVLREALVREQGPLPVAKQRTLEAQRRLGYMQWTQNLLIHEVEGVDYFTEGNGSLKLIGP